MLTVIGGELEARNIVLRDCVRALSVQQRRCPFAPSVDRLRVGKPIGAEAVRLKGGVFFATFDAWLSSTAWIWGCGCNGCRSKGDRAHERKREHELVQGVHGHSSYDPDQRAPLRLVGMHFFFRGGLATGLVNWKFVLHRRSGLVMNQDQRAQEKMNGCAALPRRRSLVRDA